MSDIIEVSNVKPVGKNSLLATCSVKIVPWKLTFSEVNIFQKGNMRWIGMPSRRYESNGETRYVEQIVWDNADIAKRFRDQVMQAVDAWLMANPNMEAPPAIKPDDEVPF